MSLALALKNRDSLVVASDLVIKPAGVLTYTNFMNIPGRAVLMIAGNLAAVRRPIVEMALPKLNPQSSAAAVVQLIHAALVLDAVPYLEQLKGRVEIIVAGIDPVRHTEEPNIYYLDSAQGFALQPIKGDFAAAGSTAVAKEMFEDRELTKLSTDELVELAKECLGSTKLRWPDSVGQYLEFGIITPKQIRIINF